ncbi:MAG: sulfatase-like hydrolase/transferase [Planctomycetota bacterium]
MNLFRFSFAIAILSFAIPTVAKRPNVILIMADDLGYEALRCNGGTSYDKNYLDELARKGMRFTHCYSQPICTPSRNKIMTGRSNARNYQAFGVLIPSEITFGNIMKKAGYKTCVAGKWQLSGGNRKSPKGTTPAKCGFDEHCMWAYKHNLPEGVTHTGGWEGKNRTSRYWHPSIIQNGEYRPTTINDYGPDIYTKFIIDFIERNKDDELFVYYPMALTHGPFYPTPHSRDLSDDIKFKNVGKKYFNDMISYTGHCVRRIIESLEKHGLDENTLVLFTTDNGTHRSLVSWMGDRVVPGGKGLTCDAGCHVPMIAYWKGKITSGSTCSDLIEFSDFVPTIAELGNAELPNDRVLDGRSFLPQLKGEKGNPRTSVFVHYDKTPDKEKPDFRRVRFAYNGKYKLYLDGRIFDVPNDVDERSPIKRESLSPEALSTIAMLQERLDSMPPWKPDNSLLKVFDPGINFRNKQLEKYETAKSK